MPKIFEYFGLVFFFYANEHLPVHVHVSKAEFESKIELIFENGKLKDCIAKEVNGRPPLPGKELKEALKFVQAFALNIADKWQDFFVLNKRVNCEIITKKL